MKCQNCKNIYKHIGQGEGWYECSIYKKNNDTYGNILYGLFEKPKKTPKWCPLKKAKENV